MANSSEFAWLIRLESREGVVGWPGVREKKDKSYVLITLNYYDLAIDRVFLWMSCFKKQMKRLSFHSY